MLQAAHKVLLEGEGELEMLQVARRAGVSEGLAYYHFGNRAGLLKAVVRDFYRRFDDAIGAVPFPGKHWLVREEARTKEAVRFMYEDPVASLVLNVVRADPALHAEEVERTRRLNRLGARSIAKAQRDGQISRAHDPSLLVAMILGGVMAAVTEALATQPPKPLPETQKQVWAFVVRAAGLEERRASSPEKG